MFWIDDTVVYDAKSVCKSCGCSHDDGEYTSLEDMAYDCLALSLERLGKAEPGSIVKKAELANRDDVPYLEMELAAALVLAADAGRVSKTMQDILYPVMGDEEIIAEEVYDAIDRANRVWREESFNEETEKSYRDAILLAMAVGVLFVNDAVFVDEAFRTPMIEAMVRAGKYYTNEYFNTQVIPSLYDAVTKVTIGDQTGAKLAFSTVRQTLDKRLASVPYWNVVANAASSRAYHTGVLRAGQLIGKTTFTFVAVRDERTSEICRLMHGKVFTVDQGLDLMQRVAAAEDPEEVKAITPWLRINDVRDLSASELAQAGIMIPPLHGNCRSTIELS